MLASRFLPQRHDKRRQQAAPFTLYTIIFLLLEISVVRSAGERNDVADVSHTCHEEQQALEAEAEARVGAGTILAGVEIPPHILHGDTQLLNASEQLVIVSLTL